MDATERRAADQDAALEHAFVAGTLPEEDRRTPAEKAADDKQAAKELADSKLSPPAVSPPLVLPVEPAISLTPAQHRRSAILVTEIGRTVPNARFPQWNELLKIWGHR
jgi:hypothetical protein